MSMPTLTIELLNSSAKSILNGLEDAGLIMIGESIRTGNADDFWHQKSVDELAEEQGVAPINDLDRLFGCGKDLWETEREWNDYMESMSAGRKERA